jgi:hypothetical protein
MPSLSGDHARYSRTHRRPIRTSILSPEAPVKEGSAVFLQDLSFFKHLTALAKEVYSNK